MKDILAEIVEKKKGIVARDKEQIPLYQLKQQLLPGEFRMSRSLKAKEWSLIAECKLQSPAKGRLCSRYDVVELAKMYQKNHASVLSVHTDPHFLGCDEDIRRVKAVVDLPVLRKDFIIDPYQIYQARYLGADAVLLIARILTPEQLRQYLYIAWELGMDALVEVHDEADLKMAQQTPAECIGINNRNLKTFQTDIQNTLDLLSFCDRSRMLISESGIYSAADTACLQEAGLQGALVGEGLVRAEDIGRQTRDLALVAAKNMQSAG